MVESPLTALRRVRHARTAIPEGVRRLSWVSFWNDAASELAYPLIPIFLTVVLAAPVAVVGVTEGVGEAVSAILRAPFGAWSDRRGRKRFVRLGYGASAVTKPLLAVAPAWGLVLALRVVDRAGKGIRSAPRDAMISDLSAPDRRGAAFGYHRTMDTLGAVLGPLVALLLLISGVPIRWVLGVACAPALVTLTLLARLPETARRVNADRARPEPWTGWLRLVDRRLRWVLAGWTIFSLGNSSDAFLILRASHLGLSPALVVLAYAGYNLVFAFAAWPAGVVSDRLGRRCVLVVGLAIFVLVYAGFGVATSSWQLWPLFGCYGLYIALTDGAVKAVIGDIADPDQVGATLGLVTAASGLSALAASIAAGVVWGRFGPGAVFALGAALAAAAGVVISLAPIGPRRALNPDR